MKRIVALLLALLLLTPLFGAAAEDKPTLTIFVGTETYTPDDINTMQLFQKAEAATGVHIN